MASQIFIECVYKTRGRDIPKRRVVALCENLFKIFSKNSSLKRSKPLGDDPHLTVVFVSPKTSQKLNLQYRKKNYPTDILSFSSHSVYGGLGELVICPQILKRQAKDVGHSTKKELDYMLIHGFLHLLGYDHEKSRREELKMMRLQDKLFTKLSK